MMDVPMEKMLTDCNQNIIDYGINSETSYSSLTSANTVLCSFCHKSFNTQNECDSHSCFAEIVNPDIKYTTSYQCVNCKLSFWSMSFLQEHLCMHREKKSEICDTELVSRKLLDETISAVQDIANASEQISDNCFNAQSIGESKLTDGNKCDIKTTDTHNDLTANVCSICKTKFANDQCYREHITKHRTQYDCTLCDVTFHTKKLWNEHKRSVHKLKPDTKMHKCGLCDKVFHRPVQLSVHQRIHSGEKPVSCELCQKSFRSKNGLMRHQRTAQHLKLEQGKNIKIELPFHCKECDHKFPLLQTLTRHMEITHKCTKLFDCSYCDYSSKYEANLQRHIETHLKIKNFICDKCGASFYRQALLNKHSLYVHSDKRDFICEWCNKAFKRHQTLRRHLNDHHIAERPFTCFCDKSYKRMFHLKRHMFSAHKINTTSGSLENSEDLMKFLQSDEVNCAKLSSALSGQLFDKNWNQSNSSEDIDQPDNPPVPNLDNSCLPALEPPVLTNSVPCLRLEDYGQISYDEEEAQFLAFPQSFSLPLKDANLTLPENLLFSPSTVDAPVLSRQPTDYGVFSNIVNSLWVSNNFTSDQLKTTPVSSELLFESDLCDPPISSAQLPSGHEYINNNSSQSFLAEWSSSKVPDKNDDMMTSIMPQVILDDDCTNSLLMSVEEIIDIEDNIDILEFDLYSN